MQRREIREPPSEATHTTILPDPAASSATARAAFAGMLLASLLSASLARAESATLPDVSAPPPASVQLVDEAPPEDPIPPVHSTPEPVRHARLDLEELLFVPSVGRGTWRPQTTDELLAVAVAEGTHPELEPPKPFRKRSRDLFRTERPVSIGNQEMLMRLRLRAKAKKAVSVELHF